MKKVFLVTVLTMLVGSQPLLAADVGFDMNINIGNGGGRTVVAAPPPQQIVIDEPPEFIVPSTLGFYVAVGVPYDLFYVSNSYYLYRGNTWYRGSRYNGPWVATSHSRLPPGLRRHKYQRIRSIRDEEYRRYREDEGHYRGKHFRPGREAKEHRKEEHERMKEERKWEKEDRKREKEDRKHGRHNRDDD
ncbi:YXWGXW repeat-containing protein [Geotalea uraniireducens]|uniref:Uncharacterized protein n=1 Tax=Geotalea uraniireducens (strain Rf4) TaxID=351605 RepID=A5G4F6_GEOUR|nr:YXWGXW repeat-containing protein [Geotalea uraniireducens]ABQ26674.1 hypothetical protein Gura_2496 [Geotalea uraniireducens Rf4]